LDRPLAGTTQRSRGLDQDYRAGAQFDASAAPILMLIHTQPGHCLEDYARELRPISLEHNLPTIISGPPIGDGDADDLPADVLPVWLERGEVHRMEAETFGDLLETLSQVHCPGQWALTA
jgi:hypothetical protein